MSFVGGIACLVTCCNAPPLLGKYVPVSNFRFILRGGDGGDGLDRRKIRLGTPSEWKVSFRGDVQYTRLGSSSE